MNTDIINKLQNTRYTVTLSAEHAHTEAAANDAATQLLHSDIQALGLNHSHAHGYYEGHPEQSFVVYCDDMFDVLRLLPLRSKYNQDCLLVVDNTANCAMLYWDNTTTLIGNMWEEIPLTDTYDIDAFTAIEGKYYAIK